MNLFVCFWAAGFLLAADPYAAPRERMVRDQIESRGVRHAEVLRVMREIPRHLFVPAQARSLAYGDHPLPIGYRATISQPYIVALMTELVAPRRAHKVLEIGTGSGYQAAVLSRLVRSVYTVEIVPELADSARRRLNALGFRNVNVYCADGYRGWPEAAPFDGILLTAAPPEIPPALVAQLAPGGKLVAPVGRLPYQDLVLVEKDAAGNVRRRSVTGVTFVPMVPGPRPAGP